jgi:hypothetical protein
MVLPQKEIFQKQLQIFRRLMNAVFQVIVVGSNEGIAEVPGVLCKMSFVTSNPSVLRYLIKKTAVVLVFPSPKQ